jgi:hypothetical protein
VESNRTEKNNGEQRIEEQNNVQLGMQKEEESTYSKADLNRVEQNRRTHEQKSR